MNYQPYIDRLKKEKEKEKKLRANRRRRALEVAKELSTLLKNEFGAKKVYLFGSSLSNDTFYLHSDIDLGVEGIAPEKYLRALYEVNALHHGFKVDLIDLETCDDYLKRRILTKGREL
ncbi:nucleotidyltransferase domain-containing protein [candidate division KSB1 bacterium]|nr:nucleotidyltransferase domain-containing protein [candidate division KSB1 bacterium]NIR72582.1 nucleotidyltransferase domain-containing protein [candidate division KSB1 bacterium]NIS26892.1 nucleotidyltransferase domain-containing protein [candidate division KSB1 bacterium]NIT73728.1 nucleotidyltransferase domain-containing protein [candidate division KSB1 bacterium]NIU25002.1 nucleotidyltransferase domain-containing protein [candidate division KSB1 bacterium]